MHDSRLCDSSFVLDHVNHTADPLASTVVDAPNDEEEQASCQLACSGRRPTEALQDGQLPIAAPFDAAAAHRLAPIDALAAAGAVHQEPPLLPPQRPEHKVGVVLLQKLIHVV